MRRQPTGCAEAAPSNRQHGKARLCKQAKLLKSECEGGMEGEVNHM